MTTTASASTRETYGKVLLELGRGNPDIVAVGGDLNKSTSIWDFAREFPDRFFDFGPAEQNIMGVAAGLASADKVPFVSTFVVFSTGRPYDQIRVSIAQPHLNVKIVATHGGIITGEDGISAHGIEDMALMGALPGFTVVIPADATETAEAIRAIAAMNGPCYVRLARPATPIVHDECRFTLGMAELMRAGSDVTIIACGYMVGQALEAATTLEQRGVSARVVNMHTVAPADVDAIVEAAGETGAIVTAEEHLRHGGLGSVVAQVLAEHQPTPLRMVSLTGYAESGAPGSLLEKYGLSTGHVVAAVEDVLRRKSA